MRGPSARFKGLEADYWLEGHGWKDDASSWSHYRAYLKTLAEDEAEQKPQGFDAMCKGWLLGTKAWKKAMAREHAHLKLTAGIDRVQARQLKEARWEQRLAALLGAEGMKTLAEGRKNEAWKLEVALRLRHEEGASATWLAQAMNLGTPATVR